MIYLSDIVDAIVEKSEPMKLVKEVGISDRLKYHLDNRLTLEQNVFRIYSESYFKLVNEVRGLYNDDAIELNDDDLEEAMWNKMRMNLGSTRFCTFS